MTTVTCVANICMDYIAYALAVEAELRKRDVRETLPQPGPK